MSILYSVRARRWASLIGIGLLVAFIGVVFFSDNEQVARERETFQFAVVGDTDYDVPGHINAAGSLKQMIAHSLNQENMLAFVVHVGDESLFFRGCTAANIKAYIVDQFNTSVHPWIYTPGDNEWADCGQAFPGYPEVAPLDALSHIRALAFPRNAINSQAESLGRQRITLIRQSDLGDDLSTPFDETKFVENQRWVHEGVMFVTIHAVGSRDNCAMLSPNAAPVGNLSDVPSSCSDEKREREAANLAWLHDTFRKAKEGLLQGVVVLTQANFAYGSDNNDGTCPADLTTDQANTCKAFLNYRRALRDEALNFGKPILLMHGDGHKFQIQKPMTDVPTFTRVMTFGPTLTFPSNPTPPDTGWLRVTVDPSNPELFLVSCGGIVKVDASQNYLGTFCIAPALQSPTM